MSYVKQAYVDFGCTPGNAGDVANKIISNRIKLHYPCTFELNNIKQKINNSSEAILFCNVLLNMYRVVINEFVLNSFQAENEECCNDSFGCEHCDPNRTFNVERTQKITVNVLCSHGSQPESTNDGDSLMSMRGKC